MINVLFPGNNLTNIIFIGLPSTNLYQRIVSISEVNHQKEITLIAVSAGMPILLKSDTINIGKVVLANDMLVRRLVVLGFDTLEVHSDVGSHGCQWQLHDYIMIGQGEKDDE